MYSQQSSRNFIDINPYKAKHPWPPEFSSLSQKEQFRLERKYRRRAKLAYTRPRWQKTVKLAQWSLGSFVVIYGVFFYEWDTARDEKHEPFHWVSRQ
jgi:hypothetical protein